MKIPLIDQRARVALIFREYNHPVQPYLVSWADQLEKSQGLALQKFIMSGKPSADVVNIGYISRWSKFTRLIDLTIQHPEIPAQWFRQSKGIPLPLKRFLLLKYYPLLCFQPDIIHLTTSNEFVPFEKLLQTRKYKSIASFRGYDIVVRPLANPAWVDTLQDLFSKVDILHFVSNYLRDEGIKLGAPEAKCRVIHPSTALASKMIPSKFNESGQVIKIVSTGRLTWQKGFSQALQVIQKIIESGVLVDYSILGDGPEKEHLLYMVQNLGLSDYVHIKGLQTQEFVRQTLTEADIYFHPSESEAIPVAIMEAAALGKPIVASNVGGIPEAIEDGVSGLLIPPYDCEAMVNGLLTLINSPELSSRLGETAYKRAVSHFSVERECKEWEDLYSTLARK